VVVNYGGGDLTFRCLQSLLASEWPAEQLRIVLVDNPVDGALTSDGVASRVEAELPSVRVVRSTTNRGFAGGCNLGMQETRDTDFVALVNNDATVAPGWLAPLVAALQADETLGAACPKILFATPYVELILHASTHRRGRGDRRDLGIRLSGARVGTEDAWTRVQLVDGFWGTEPAPADEPGAQWTTGSARLRLPVSTSGTVHTAALRLASDESTTVTISSGDETVAVGVGTEPAWHELPLAGPPSEIVNNVGSVVHPDGSGADRGFLEPDDGRFDEPVDVDAWCGAAVLLSRAYLDDLEGFDERLFLYYEDVEMSVRGHERGWRYRFVPESVVRHVHSATSIEGSSLARYYNERNRLLVMARHESLGRTLRASGRSLLVTGSYARRDIVSPVLHGRRPRVSVVSSRLHAFGGFLRKAPAMRRSGRND
jgi:hypothetical protein